MPWGTRWSSCWSFCTIRPYSARHGSWRSQRAQCTICSSRARAKVSWQRRRLIWCFTPLPRIAANRWCTNFWRVKHCRKKRRPITFTVNTQEKEAGKLWSTIWNSRLFGNNRVGDKGQKAGNLIRRSHNGQKAWNTTVWSQTTYVVTMGHGSVHSISRILQHHLSTIFGIIHHKS